jgi:site-specific DNA recombinase
MKAILLARVSTEEQDTKAQVERLQNYVTQKDFTDVELFDFDESAHKDLEQRKKFQKVLDKLKNSKNTIALVCDKIDRMTRDFLRFLPLIDELRKSKKVVLHFPSDNMILHGESSASDLFRFNIGVALAQYYSDSISDNVKRKIESKLRNGQILSKAPYGYRNIRVDEKNTTVKVDPVESQIVKKMYEWYVSEAFSIREIIKKLYDEYGVEMPKSSVGRILENKFYIGIALYKKKDIEYPHVYQSIIAEDTFWKVQEIKSGRTQWDGKGKYAGKSFYYRNLVRCGICGYSMSPEEQRGKHYYCCTEYGGKHGAKYVSEDILTNQFVEIFKGFALTDEVAKRLFDDLVALGETSNYASKELASGLRGQFDILKDRKKGLIRIHADGSINKEEYLEEVRFVDKELKQITEKLSKVEEVDQDFYLTAGLIIELARNSGELFKRSEDEERRLLVKTVLSNVTWNGENLSYTYNTPFDTLRKIAESPIWGDLRGSNP